MANKTLNDPVEDAAGEIGGRDKDLLGRGNSPCRKWLEKQIKSIVEGFEDQAERSDKLDRWWRMYNCELDENQYYNGNAGVYVPLIRDAINARTTRFANQLFPQSGHYIDATATDGSIPYEMMAIVNQYIADAKLKTEVIRPLMRAGDLEGQYNLYLGWAETRRQIVSRETREARSPDTNMPIPGQEIVDIVEEEIVEGRPTFEVLHDSDVLVLPATADSIEDALEMGGSVTIVRRWSKEQYRQMRTAGEVRGEGEIDDNKMVNPTLAGLQDMEKALARTVGVRAKGPHFLAFETFLLVPLGRKGKKQEIAFDDDDGERRLCRLWWGLDREPLGLKRNPYWNDLCPLLSAPVEKIAGVFKGQSLVEPLAPLQYEANDAANERADIEHMAAMPIIRRGGADNAPIIIAPGAVWNGEKDQIDFLAFPDLSERSRKRIADAASAIFQALAVNPAMLPQQTGRPGAKRNQAEIALEQAVDLLTVAEAVEVPTEAILTPTIRWIVDLDHQFRDRRFTVRAYGEMGMRAEMIDVPPIENRHHYRFVWSGAQQAKQNMAMMQQGTALLNVSRGLAPQLQAEGYQLRLGPALEKQWAQIVGPEMARLMLVDQRRQLGFDQETENEWLMDGFLVPVQAGDDDKRHPEILMPALQASGDPHGTMRVHAQLHMRQMQMKTAMAGMQRMAAQMQTAGGGGGAAPRGTPPGAVPAQPHAAKGPPGMVHPDAMPRMGGGVVPIPRKM